MSMKLTGSGDGVICEELGVGKCDKNIVIETFLNTKKENYFLRKYQSQ